MGSEWLVSVSTEDDGALVIEGLDLEIHLSISAVCETWLGNSEARWLVYRRATIRDHWHGDRSE